MEFVFKVQFQQRYYVWTGLAAIDDEPFCPCSEKPIGHAGRWLWTGSCRRCHFQEMFLYSFRARTLTSAMVQPLSRTLDCISSIRHVLETKVNTEYHTNPFLAIFCFVCYRSMSNGVDRRKPSTSLTDLAMYRRQGCVVACQNKPTRARPIYSQDGEGKTSRHTP